MNKRTFKRYLMTETGRIFDTKENLVGPYFDKKKSCFVIASFIPRLGGFVIEKVEKESDSLIELEIGGGNLVWLRELRIL